MKQAISILRNKFNYSERQSQTVNPQIKEKGVSTAKPVLKNFSAEVNQSIIFDIFVKEHHAQLKREEEEKKKSSKDKDHHTEKAVEKKSSIYSTSFKRCLKIMERMQSYLIK